jgi:hypothetical protein
MCLSEGRRGKGRRNFFCGECRQVGQNFCRREQFIAASPSLPQHPAVKKWAIEVSVDNGFECTDFVYELGHFFFPAKWWRILPNGPLSIWMGDDFGKL